MMRFPRALIAFLFIAAAIALGAFGVETTQEGRLAHRLRSTEFTRSRISRSRSLCRPPRASISGESSRRSVTLTAMAEPT